MNAWSMKYFRTLKLPRTLTRPRAANSRYLGAGTTAVIAALLVACQSAPTRLYTLYAVAPSTPAGAYEGPPVRVDAVHVPPALDRIEMIRDKGPGELEIRDFDLWSAPLGQAARQALSADMAARLPRERIISPHLAKPADALGIVVDVLDFKIEGGRASLQASWLIVAPDPKAAAIRGSVDLNLEQADTSAAATARTLSALLAQLADHIVVDLQQHCCSASP